MLLLSACAAPAPEPPPPAAVIRETPTIPAFNGAVPRNLLLLSIDTLRRDRAMAPGAMPFLQGLAAEGYTLADHATCGNWTLLGIACSVNGRLNEENGFVPEHADLRAPVPDGPTLAGALGDRHAILVSGNSWFTSEWNADQGFDESTRARGDAMGIVGDAIDALELAIDRGDAEAGWLVHAHVMEPHAPYAPPQSYLAAEEGLAPIPWDLGGEDGNYLAGDAWPTLTESERALLQAHLDVRYGAELAWLDDQLEAIWADLRARGVLDDTLVVIFNDHGEQLFDHGHESHAYALYGEETDGLAVFWADSIVPGTWGGPTSQIDLPPTLLGLLGVEVPREMTGIPVGAAPDHRATFALSSARIGTFQSVRRAGFKLVYTWRTGALELYDLATDPDELVDVYDPADPVAIGLWEQLRPHVELAEPLVLDDAPVWPAALPP
jgi:hypothetical protein